MNSVMHPALDQLVLDALEKILAGATASTLEGQHLEFKEDPAKRDRRHGNPKALAIEILTDTCICFANAEGVSHIVFGVNDKAAGPEAFTGTDLDADELQSKVFQNTEPGLTTEVFPYHFAGARLIIIRIPKQLEVFTRKNGAATKRVGDKCQPINDVERQRLRLRRMNPDFTAQRSLLSVADLDIAAVSEGIYRVNAIDPARSVNTPLELLRLLGVVDSDGTPLVAAELLFGRHMDDVICAAHLWRKFPGAEPQRNDIRGPLIFAIRRTLERIRDNSNAEMSRVEIPSGEEIAIPDFPQQAVDEVVINAFAHRDWTVSLPVTVEQSPQVLVVDSPGGLPWGVDSARLLSVSSTPRNPVLMNAIRVLGLAEQTSRGFDRMYFGMLSSGRPAPNVLAADTHVRVSFVADTVNVPFVRMLYALRSVFSADVALSVGAVLILHEFISVPALTLSNAAELLQISQLESKQMLLWLQAEGVVSFEQVTGLWRPSVRLRELMSRFSVAHSDVVDLGSWIESALVEGALTNRQIVEMTGAPSAAVTVVLRKLMEAGAVQKDGSGPQRGPAVRWMLVK